MMKLKGKVAFITGFGSGLGQAIAVMFAKEGAAVAGTSPTESKGLQTVALVEKLGGSALYWPGDVSNSAQMKTLIAETVRQLGGIDIVVNSGGVRTTRTCVSGGRVTPACHASSAFGRARLGGEAERRTATKT